MWVLFGKLGLKYRSAPIFNYWVLYIFKDNFSDFHHVSLYHASCGHHFIFQQFPSYFHIFFVRISWSLKNTTVSELVSVESVTFPSFIYQSYSLKTFKLHLFICLLWTLSFVGESQHTSSNRGQPTDTNSRLTCCFGEYNTYLQF